MCVCVCMLCMHACRYIQHLIVLAFRLLQGKGQLPLRKAHELTAHHVLELLGVELARVVQQRPAVRDQVKVVLVSQIYAYVCVCVCVCVCTYTYVHIHIHMCIYI